MEYINNHSLETTPHSETTQHTGVIVLLHQHLPMEVFIIGISRYNTFSLLGSKRKRIGKTNSCCKSVFFFKNPPLKSQRLTVCTNKIRIQGKKVHRCQPCPVDPGAGWNWLHGHGEVSSSFSLDPVVPSLPKSGHANPILLVQPFPHYQFLK